MRVRAAVLACALTALPVALSGLATAAPAKPTLFVGNHTFVALGGKPARVRLGWAPVPGASKYRATWIDGDQRSDVELPATTTVLERMTTRAGQHRFAVVAVDEHGVASDPAATTVLVVAIEAFGLGFATSIPADAYAVGSRFRSKGLPCELGASHSPADVDVMATSPGTFQLRCGGEDGQPLAEVLVVIAPVHVSADTAPIVRGTRTEVHLTVASTAPIGDQLDIVPIGPLELGPPERVAGGIDIRVTPRPERDVGTGALVVRAGMLDLGRVTLDIAEPPGPSRPERVTTQWAAFDLGAYVGSFTTPHDGTDATLLGKPTDPADSISNGAVFGLRLGFFPTRRLGFETEVGLVTAAYTEHDGIAPILIVRPQVAVRAVEDGRFGLRVLLGADAMSVLANESTSRKSSIGGIHYGAAFSIETRARISVRLQALHIITVAQDAGYAHCFEIGVGVTARLGRRDRWD